MGNLQARIERLEQARTRRQQPESSRAMTAHVELIRLQIRGKISEEEANRRRALLPPTTRHMTPLGLVPIEELRSRVRHVPEVIDSPVETQPVKREAEEIGDATEAEQAFVDRLNDSLMSER